MSFFDSNLSPPFCRHSTAFQLVLEAADESWSNRLLSVRGFAPDLPVSTVCRSLPGQSLRQGFLLLGSVPFSGLRSPASVYPSLRFLHYARQERDAVLPTRLAPRATIRRTALRPNHSARRSAHGPALPRPLTAHPLFRCRERLAPDVPDRQFSSSRCDHRPTGSRAGKWNYSFAGSNSTSASGLSTAPPITP